MKLIPVVGKSDSGKTTFLEKLIPEIKKRGYSVAVIKHDAHGFDIDHEGKDTYRIKHAGADAVLISSPQKIALIKDHKEELPLDRISKEYFLDFDVVLTEGFKTFPIPKIEVYRKEAHAEPLCKPEELILIATDTSFDIKAPQFGLDDIAKIVDHLQEKVLDKPQKTIKTRLSIDGKKIPMKSFVQDFVAQTVAGMASALNGVDNPKKIFIEIDLDD